MKTRMGLVTVLLCALTACSVPGLSSEESDPSPSASTPQSGEPSQTTGAQNGEQNDDQKDKPGGEQDGGNIDGDSIVGDWTSAEVEWTVHFKSDGSFVEDFQGFEDFRVGQYSVEDDKVTLVGGDGYSDVGTIQDDGSLRFKLGTLTREG